MQASAEHHSSHSSQPEALLSVRNLKTYFYSRRGVARAVDGVSLSVIPSRVVALVGESGSGKSVTALSILKLVQEPPGKIVEGRVEFHGRDLLSLNEREMRRIRGGNIAMIFQEPMTSLNPVFTVGFQVCESLRLHRGMGRKEARIRAAELFDKVRIPNPRERLDQYPHELSGGMRQRVMIAMALAGQPDLLLADEPTTALDVTIQAQILDTLMELNQELGMAILLITHDMGIVAEMADEVSVMYAGRIVEQSAVGELFAEPLHPYTQGLFESLPRLEAKADKLQPIPGTVPDATQLPEGCKFHPRCRYMMPEICPLWEPPLDEGKPGRRVACWLHLSWEKPN